MGKVLDFKARHKKRDTASMIKELVANHQAGKLDGLIYLSLTPQGETIGIAGEFAGRLQLALYALIHATTFVSDRIVLSGTAGFTSTTDGEVTTRKKRSTRKHSSPLIGDLK